MKIYNIVYNLFLLLGCVQDAEKLIANEPEAE